MTSQTKSILNDSELNWVDFSEIQERRKGKLQNPVLIAANEAAILAEGMIDYEIIWE